MDKVNVVFNGDGAGFFRETEKIKGAIGNLSGQVMSGLKGAIFATFSVEALKQFRAEFKDFVNEIEVARKQTGASATDLQVWEKQIKKVGGEMGDLTRIINKLAVARDKAIENPDGKEGKAFAALGFDQAKIINTDAPEIFKQLQDSISKSGSGVGSMGTLMDLLGEKSVKFLRIFSDSFADTEKKMKNLGSLVDSELIERYKKLTEMNNKLSLGDALMGGKEGKGEFAASAEEAWVKLKSGLQSLTIPIAMVTDALGLSKGSSERIQNQVIDTQTQLVLNGSRGNSILNSQLAEGDLTPSQYEEMRNKSLTEIANKQAQEKRIAELRDGLRKDALTDEEKLTAMYKEQYALVQKMMAIENNKSKKTEFLSMMEEYLRNVPKIKEQQKKADAQLEKQETEHSKKEALVQEYLTGARKDMFGGVRPTDSLVATGNFLGNSRSQLESLTIQSNQIMSNIETMIRNYIAANPAASKKDFPLLF